MALVPSGVRYVIVTWIGKGGKIYVASRCGNLELNVKGNRFDLRNNHDGRATDGHHTNLCHRWRRFCFVSKCVFNLRAGDSMVEVYYL